MSKFKTKSITVTPEALEALDRLPAWVSKSGFLSAHDIIKLDRKEIAFLKRSTNHPNNNVFTRSIRITVLVDSFMLKIEGLGMVKDLYTGKYLHVSGL